MDNAMMLKLSISLNVALTLVSLSSAEEIEAETTEKLAIAFLVLSVLVLIVVLIVLYVVCKKSRQKPEQILRKDADQNLTVEEDRRASYTPSIYEKPSHAPPTHLPPLHTEGEKIKHKSNGRNTQGHDNTDGDYYEHMSDNTITTQDNGYNNGPNKDYFAYDNPGKQQENQENAYDNPGKQENFYDNPVALNDDINGNSENNDYLVMKDQYQNQLKPDDMVTSF